MVSRSRRLQGVPHRLEQVGRVQLDLDAGLSEGTVQLGQRPGQRAVLVAPRDGEQGTGRRGQSQALARAEATGSGQGRTHPGRHRVLGDHDLEQLVRRVGRHAAAGGHLELGHQRGRCEVEPGGHLVDGGLPLLGQPGEDGQQAAEPGGGVDGRAHRTAPGSADEASRRSTTAARTSSGRSTSAWSSRSRTQDTSASTSVTTSRTTTPPSSVRSTTASGPELGHHPGRLGRVDGHVDLDRLARSEVPGIAGELPVGVESVGQLRRSGRPDLGRPVDSVDPERPGLALGRGPAQPRTSARPGSGCRPRPPTGGRPGRRSPRWHRCGPRRTAGAGPAGRPPGEGRPAAAGHRAGASSPPIPSLESASLPIGSPRWTPATARFRAACSSGSRPRSGR